MLNGLREIWGSLGRFHARAYLILLLAFGSTALELGVELLIRPLVDQGIMGGDLPAFGRILLLQLGLYLAGMALNLVHVRAYMALSCDVSEQLRLDLFEKAQRIPLARYASGHAAHIPTRLLNEVGSVAAVLGQLLGSIGVSLLQALGAAVVLLYLDWKLALCVLALVPVNLVLSRRAGDVSAVLEKEYYGQYESAARFLEEKFSFAAKLALADPRARAGVAQRFQALAREMRETSYKLGVVPHLLDTASFGLSMLGSLAVYGLGGYLVIQGRMSLGSLLAFFAVKSFLERPLAALGATHIGLKEALVHWQRLREVGDAAVPRRDGRPLAAGDLELRGASFRYPGAGAPVIDRVDCRIPRGKLTVITGPTGAGKSTLSYLLTGHLELPDGAVSIGGAPIGELSEDSLSSSLAYLGQQPYMLAGSIRDNLTLYRPEATEKEIRDACRIAAVQELIDLLPAGLATDVSEQGSSLSGGEKQRLCLARAILKRPAILVLDEPTSAVDPDTEEAICAALRRLVDAEGVTVVAITHKPALRRVADAVLRLDGGVLSPAA